MTEPKMSLFNTVLLFGFGMIGGCVVGLIGRLHDLKQANSELEMKNFHLKKELANIEINNVSISDED